MLRKTVLSVAVASTLTLVGCGSNESTDTNAGSRNDIEGPLVSEINGLFRDKTWPRFNLAISDVPVPNDLIFDTVAADGTFRDAAAGSTNPVLLALGALSGASTTAAIDIPYSGGLTAASVVGSPFLTNPDGSLLKANGNSQLGIPDTPIPNPFQNVFLIELDYGSGDPLTGFSAAEPPTIPLAVQFQTLSALGAQIQAAVAASDFATVQALTPTAIAVANKINAEVDMLPYTATVLDMNGTTVLRIQPKKPLKPRVRYVVATTDEVLDASGIATSQDPAYYNLSAGLTAPSAALRPAQALVTGLWEPIAASYFGLTNSSRASAVLQGLIPSIASLPQLAQSDITVSYSFMTSGDEKVLEYIANPTEWFDDSLTNFVRVSARTAFLAAPSDISGPAGQPDTKVDYFDVKAAADTAVAGFPSEAVEAALAPLFAAEPPSGCSGLTGSSAITCVATILAAAPSSSGGFADLLPKPATREDSLDLGSPAPLATVSAVPSTIPGFSSTLVVQGTIDLPYYLGIPTGNTAPEGTVLQTSSWTADGTLADAMNAAFAAVGLALPQGDTQAREATSEVVNYLFPFPAQSDADPDTAGVQDLTIPILATYPLGYDGETKMPVVIFQHGITTDRSAALSVGALLAANGYATIAIDQPLHGVDAFTSTAQRNLAKTLVISGGVNSLTCDSEEADIEATIDAIIAQQLSLLVLSTAKAASCPSLADLDLTDAADRATATAAVLNGLCGAPARAQLAGALGLESAVANASSVIPGLARTDHERHFNFTANATLQPIPMDFANGVGSSGSLFINLSGFTNSRDKNRQASLDLLNLLVTLPDIDLNGDSEPDLDPTKVYFIGHSLGTVAGTPFVTVANSSPAVRTALGLAAGVPAVKASVLLTPASGIPRMLENSPTFSPSLVAGLAASGVSQGSANFETFMRILQAALDSADPINFADNLNIGIDYSSSDTYSLSNRFQTSATNSGVLMIEIAGRPDENGATLYKSDPVNVIETETTQLTNATFGTTAFPDLLSGTNKLTAQMSPARTPLNVLDAPALNGSPDILVSRLSFGEHGMFVLPVVSSGQADICPLVTDADYLAKVTRTQNAFGHGMTQAIAFLAANGEMSPAVPNAALLEEETDFQARDVKQLNCANGTGNCD